MICDFLVNNSSKLNGQAMRFAISRATPKPGRATTLLDFLQKIAQNRSKVFVLHSLIDKYPFFLKFSRSLLNEVE